MKAWLFSNDDFYINIYIACTTSAYHYTDPVPQNFWGQRTRWSCVPKMYLTILEQVLDPIPPYKNFGPKGTLWPYGSADGKNALGNVCIHPSRSHSFAFVPPLNVSEELPTGKSLRLHACPAYLLKTVVPWQAHDVTRNHSFIFCLSLRTASYMYRMLFIMH